ncbi:MAG TPA: cysteine desulfurase [Paludibacteraceae bacterium]|nr:cysteine desulfurase [Paludibacteraceae bacterium]HPL93668.1 cysteine desulfurase [Paludibacteraceae bacterium]
MSINNQLIRQDFPILLDKIYNKPLVYFDNAATTQKPMCVIDRIVHGYTHGNANIHRGVHFLSQKATEEHENARTTVQHFIHAARSSEIIFTRGTTESINLVAFSFGETFCQPGDEIIISAIEHHANIVPWQMLKDRKGIVLKVIPMLPDGTLDMPAFSKLLNNKTKLVAVTHVSNVLGTINPIQEIIQLAHNSNVPVLIDGAQAVPHIAIDVQQLDVDFYVFSAHKVYGPTGIGVLYGKEEWLNKMQPYQGGGEMIAKVTFEKTTYNELPFKFEAGTPDYIGSTALATALEYIQQIGLNAIATYENDLLQYATAKLLQVPGLKIYGEASHKSSVISFLVQGIHHYDMGTLLDKLGIAVRTGHHCAQPIMDYYGIEGTVRASFAFYNTKEEVDKLIEGVNRVVSMFKI